MKEPLIFPPDDWSFGQVIAFSIKRCFQVGIVIIPIAIVIVIYAKSFPQSPFSIALRDVANTAYGVNNKTNTCPAAYVFSIDEDACVPCKCTIARCKNQTLCAAQKASKYNCNCKCLNEPDGISKWVATKTDKGFINCESR